MTEMHLGDVTISAILEIEKPGPVAADFFVGFDELLYRRYENLLPTGQTIPSEGRIVLAFQSFVVRTPRSIALIDTCCGEDKFLPGPMPHSTARWRDGLHALGLSEGDIDYVFCTHLHIDHTGWNTRLERGWWVPNFPNAIYLFSRREYAYWEALAKSGEARPRIVDGIWEMNCLPIVEAGQALLVDDGHVLDEYLSLIPTPGHSPHHVCVRISSGGHDAIAIGDLMHSAIQCAEPGWSSTACWDPAAASMSRRRILDGAADRGTLILPVHFPHPSVGRVERNGDGFRYEFGA